ncbi:MAG: hypothetical protein NC390_03225 [Fusobacterium sp.]|nr:hypothetical protein [Fusobacterium sp.]
MDKQLARRIIILSALAGVILGVVSIIPVIVKLAVFVLMTCVSVPVMMTLRKYGVYDVSSVKSSLMAGALSGFISYMVFSAVFLPLVFVISYFFAIGYLGGLVLMLKLSNFGLVLMFTIFISIVSVIFNAFSSLLYYYIVNIFTGEKDGRF